MTKPSTQNGELFFSIAALLLFLVVLAGFGPSFYFRSAELTPLSNLFVLHGWCLTAWFALGLVQSALIVVSRPLIRAGHGQPGKLSGSALLSLHKGLGLFSCLLVAAWLTSGWLVSLDFYQRGTTDSFISPAGLLMINLANLVSFSICYGAGLLRRKRARHHMRWMLFASVMIVAPAALRLSQYLGLPPVSSFLFQLGIVLALLLYDRRHLGRIHRVTWLGLALLFAQSFGAFALGKSTAWEHLAHQLLATG